MPSPGRLTPRFCFREPLAAADRSGCDQTSACDRSIGDFFRRRNLASIAERQLRRRGSMRSSRPVRPARSRRGDRAPAARDRASDASRSRSRPARPRPRQCVCRGCGPRSRPGRPKAAAQRRHGAKIDRVRRGRILRRAMQKRHLAVQFRPGLAIEQDVRRNPPGRGERSLRADSRTRSRRAPARLRQASPSRWTG